MPMAGPPRTLLIACGALAREVLALLRSQRWEHMEVSCLPAKLHNRPDLIPEAVRARIRSARAEFDRILVVYGDCGTGGRLDAVLAEENIERIDGPHCYSFYAGAGAFDAMMADEPGSFFLTDYLVRQFDTLIIEGLGIDRHPELRDMYFGNYRRLVYLAQSRDPALEDRARAAAVRLGLEYEYRFTGFGELGPFIEQGAQRGEIGRGLLA